MGRIRLRLKGRAVWVWGIDNHQIFLYGMADFLLIDNSRKAVQAMAKPTTAPTKDVFIFCFRSIERPLKPYIELYDWCIDRLHDSQPAQRYATTYHESSTELDIGGILVTMHIATLRFVPN